MPKGLFFNLSLEQACTSQNGCKVFYSILYMCHPKLVEKSKREHPTLQTNVCLFTFIKQCTNYIESTQITNHNYTEIRHLAFVMNILECDGIFDKCLGS